MTHARRLDRPAGFTLVELLIVLGIIGVLIAVLLPVLGAVRARSREVTCAEHLRAIHQALRTRASEHDGYLPLGGRVTVTDWSGPISAALGDSGKRRFDYVRDALAPGGEKPMPWPATLARHLGDQGTVIATSDDVRKWGSREGSPSLRLFGCPAAEPAQNFIPMAIDTIADRSTQMEGFSAPIAYSINSEAFGFDATAGVNMLTRASTGSATRATHFCWPTRATHQ